MLSECVEGSIALYQFGSEFIYGLVKGYHHPSNALIIFPYRHPSTCKPRVNIVTYDTYYKWLPCIGRFAPVIDLNEIINCITPWKALEFTELDSKIKEFINILVPDKVGITGSRAVGCNSPSSDLDLVLFSSEPSELAKTLRKLKKSGVISQCSPGRVKRKRVDRRDFSYSEIHINNSVVESCYKGVPFTLRILRETKCTFCDRLSIEIVPLGRVEFEARLIPEDPESIMVPSRYLLEPLKPFDLGGQLYMESWRTRYADLPPGRYLIRGELMFMLRDNLLFISPDFNGGVWRV
jgi:hypothetical protein